MLSRPSDRELRAWDHAHLWHPFTAQKDWALAEPLSLERGEGVYLFDTEGKRYLDGVSSLWCNIHGHRHPTLDGAIREQLEQVAHCTLLGVTHAPAISWRAGWSSWPRRDCRACSSRTTGPRPWSRAQDGVPVLAAEAQARAGADALPGAR